MRANILAQVNASNERVMDLEQRLERKLGGELSKLPSGSVLKT